MDAVQEHRFVKIEKTLFNVGDDPRIREYKDAATTWHNRVFWNTDDAGHSIFFVRGKRGRG